ncbi:MAG TPA: hypothetical protein VF228_13945 [Iamia sp.]
MPRPATTLVATVLATLALLLAGCGDDGDSEGEGSRGRPTVEQMATALDTGTLEETDLECLAQAFVDSEMTDEGLQAIVDGGGLAGARGVSAADEAAAQDAAAQGVACSVRAGLPDMSTTAPGSTTTAADGATTTTAAPESTTTAAG